MPKFLDSEAKKLKLSDAEIRLLKKLKTPALIQDYLNKIPFNFSSTEEPYLSPRLVFKKKRAQCFEGAVLAYLSLRLNGYKTYLMELTSELPDYDHILALFKIGRYWGAVSKTNHAALRYREPVYATPRELAMSYFHEYFLYNRKKTMRAYSRLLSSKKFDKKGWATSDKDLEYIGDALDDLPHIKIMTPGIVKKLRPVDKVEIKAGRVIEWKNLGKGKSSVIIPL